MDAPDNKEEPKVVKHKFSGCKIFRGKVYVSFEEFAKFCKSLPHLKGREIALLLEQSRTRIDPKLPEVEEKESFFKKFFS